MEIGKIKAILLTEWDPLDISDNPYLTDEYDSYLPRLVKLIKADRPSQEIADHLKEIEDDLGVTLPCARRMKTAELLARK